MRFAWVPFPAPGGPRKITARFRGIVSAGSPALTSTTPNAALSHKPIVIPHYELRFQLLDRVDRHANDDQLGRAAEVKPHSQTNEHETPHVRIEPIPAQENRQVLQVNSGNHPLR